jgi:ClpP class serine protease
MQWAMLPSSFKAIVERVRGVEFTAEDRQLFHAASEDDSIRMLSDLGEPVKDARLSYVKENLGFMVVDGPIIPRADYFSEVSGMVSVERMTQELKGLQADPAVDEIIIIYDTPGGAVTGVSDLAQFIKTSDKKITSFVYGMAASAGYWLASAGVSVVSCDTGLAGSIGTIISLRDDTEALKKRGITETTFVSSQSPNKAPDTSTDKGAAVVQQLVDDMSDVFIDTVATNRGVEREKVLNSFGGGAVFVANRALKAGMIDSIQSLDSLIQSKLNNTRPFLTGFNSAAQATDTTAEALTMSDAKKDQELTEETPIEASTVAADAIKQERERIQGIEKLSECCANAPAPVKLAAQKVIDSRKFDAEANADNTAVLVMQAMNEAFSNLTAKTADGARALTEVAAKVTAKDEPKTEGKKEEGVSKDRIDAMAKTFTEHGRR